MSFADCAVLSFEFRRVLAQFRGILRPSCARIYRLEVFMAAPTDTEIQNRVDAAAHFEPLLDSVEAASLLRIHPKTLQRLARNGEIAGVQIGKLWRFRASVLNSWLTQKSSR
jgi:excisionase family DNA binding protein